MTVSEIPEYQRKRAGKRKGEKAAIDAANAKDRSLLAGDIEGLSDGSQEAWLGYASDTYNGYCGNDAPSGVERMTKWLGDDAALIATIREGCACDLGALRLRARSPASSRTARQRCERRQRRGAVRASLGRASWFFPRRRRRQDRRAIRGADPSRRARPAAPARRSCPNLLPARSSSSRRLRPSKPVIVRFSGGWRGVRSARGGQLRGGFAFQAAFDQVC